MESKLPLSPVNRRAVLSALALLPAVSGALLPASGASRRHIKRSSALVERPSERNKPSSSL